MATSISALVVEDNLGLAETLSEIAGEFAERVETAASVQAALELLEVWVPTLVLLDFALPDGTGLDVLARLEELRPWPVIVALSGEASPADGFRLAQGGVRAFLNKPCGLADVRRAIQGALKEAPEPSLDIRAQVGHVAIKDFEANIRRTMVNEALARSGGSVRGAAGLLGISRQLLQHILKSPEHEGKILRD